ncbi:uncharacterized protein LOC120352469 [Nilaparvata lugens]|uniref:uncharacterized protein LOC120352469 n=1 Tax=Nilaparvata lugens TaxID=108931 RepID=UPI00193DF4E6|nr:uncharacterized protein LOC120352469 [Nilaparvata lugens]
MEWSEEVLLRIIESYGEKPILWDPSHKLHFRKQYREDAWRAISEEFNISKEDIKRKIQNLQSSYRREKLKITNSRSTGKGRDEIYVSRWFAYDAFKFLDNKYKPRKGLTTEMEEDAVVGNCLDSESKQNQVEESEQNEEKGSQQDEEKENKQYNTSFNKKKRVKSTDSIINDAFKILKTASDNFNKTPPSDEMDSFLSFVRTKLKTYPRETQLSFQHSVMELLVKADKEILDSQKRRVESETCVLHSIQSPRGDSWIEFESSTEDVLE